MAGLVSFLCGLVFALGLGIAGMTRPEKIIGFLDVFGAWDPDLAWVMAGALAITLPGFALILRRCAPVVAERFYLPPSRAIDRRLLLGAVLFGSGWGLAGYCPGPALASLVVGDASLAVFVLTMGVGLYLGRKW